MAVIGGPVRLLPAALLLAFLLAPSSAVALEFPVVDLRRESPVGPCYAADRAIVRLAPGASRSGAALHAAAIELGLRLEPEFRGEEAGDLGSFYVAHLPEGLDLEAALARLRSLPGVRSAEPVAVLPVCAAPNDSLWSESWWYAQASGHDVHADEAWDVSTGDSAVVVAILDTGVIPYHPDLGGTIAGLSGNLWTNRVEQEGVAGLDDDGNGYVDDAHGWDFVALPGIPSGQLYAEDYLDEDADPNDYAGHGTMVAGLVGALTGNTIGVAGMAWQVRLMPLRIGWAESSSPLGYVDMSFVARAIRYATRMGANVLNCSFQSLMQSDLQAALDDATRSGVVVVSASGNNDGAAEIAEREDVIAVGATDVADGIPYFSTRGDWVDLSAPGQAITSTFRQRLALPVDSLGYRQPGYGTLSGTSFSAPLVSGAVALVEAQRGALGLRRLPPQGMLLRLRESADDISGYASGSGYGTGRLNAFRALSDRTGSLAWRGAANTVGPCVPIPLSGPARKLAWVTDDSRLLVQDWLAGDTLALVTLPGIPAGQLAAADLGGGHGVGLFIGTRNGWIAGYDTTGAALPGFPKRPSAAALAGGPALGDLDGDGVLEIVCGSGNGILRAWHADGTVVTGFGVETDGWAITSPVALSDLDGLPGVEIVAATVQGDVYAFRGDGTPLWEGPAVVEPWPVAPVVANRGGEPVVLVASGTTLRTLGADGAVRASWTLPGTVGADPALADLDGDGSDEVVLPVSLPNAIVALDSSGVAPAGLGWPAPLASPAQGAAVAGHLRGDGRPGVLMMTVGGLVALTDSARTIAAFPKPGGAGHAPTLADFAGDGATRIAAGSGADSLIYVYDAGSGSSYAAPQPWPTARGNLARTGSRLYLSPDAFAPAAVRDLVAAEASGGRVRLAWTAPGDDGTTGRASAYELRFTAVAAETAGAGGTLATGLPAPDSAGTAQSVTLAAGEPGVTRWYWLFTWDEAGNRGPVSNVCAFTPPQPPTGYGLAVGERPSWVPVRLDWAGVGAECIRVFDVTGRRVRRLGLGAGWSGSVQWDGRDEGGNLVPAGLYFARLTGGSLHAQTRIVLLP